MGEVVGLTLVDASHPDQWLHMPVPNAERLLARTMQFQGELCRFGYGRVVNGAGKTLSKDCRTTTGLAMIAWCALSGCWKTEAAQARLWTDFSRPQVNNAQANRQSAGLRVERWRQPL